MKAENLLDAIGNIDDKLIEEGTPAAVSKRKNINWIKYGSFAAGFCICIISLWGASHLFSPKGSQNMKDAAMEESVIAEEEAMTEEAVVEEEAPAEEETSVEEESVESELYENDLAYGFSVNGQTYYPISFEERKIFDLVPEEAIGLTEENTYQITKEDLGEVMGIVESSQNVDLVGATVYHFNRFAESDAICIVDLNGHYEFYVNVNSIPAQ